MAEHSIDDLSVIGSNPHQSFHQEEDFDEIYPCLGIQKGGRVVGDEMSSDLLHQSSVNGQSQLTSTLRKILQYANGMQYTNSEQFLLRKYKNLLRYMMLRQDILVQDYSILFEILYTTSKKCSNYKRFLLSLEAFTKMLQQYSQKNIYNYLKIVFALVRIKLNEKVHSQEIDTLRETCKRDQSKHLVKFIIEIIVINEVGTINQFYFLKQIVIQIQEDQKYDKKSENLTQNECIKPQTNESHKIIQQIQSITPQGSTLTSQTPTLTSQSKLQPVQILQKAMKSVEEGSKLDQQLYAAIKQIDINDIKKLQDSKKLVLMLLKVAFIDVDLLKKCLQTALYILEIFEFIEYMTQLFTTHSKSKQIQKIKKIVRTQLKRYSSDGDYFWQKICPPGK